MTQDFYSLLSLGEHPRLGALDVCPFIPVRNATMEDCVQCANNFAKKAAEEMGISGTTKTTKILLGDKLTYYYPAHFCH